MRNTKFSKQSVEQIQKYINGGMTIPEIAHVFNVESFIMANIIFINKLNITNLLINRKIDNK